MFCVDFDERKLDVGDVAEDHEFLNVVLEDLVQLVVFVFLVGFHFFVHLTDVFVGDEGFDGEVGRRLLWAHWKIRRSKRDPRYLRW